MYFFSLASIQHNVPYAHWSKSTWGGECAKRDALCGVECKQNIFSKTTGKKLFSFFKQICSLIMLSFLYHSRIVMSTLLSVLYSFFTIFVLSTACYIYYVLSLLPGLFCPYYMYYDFSLLCLFCLPPVLCIMFTHLAFCTHRYIYYVHSLLLRFV